MQNTVSEDAINAHSRSLLTIIVPQPHGLGMNRGEELTPVSGTGTPNMSFSGPRGHSQVTHYLRVKCKRPYTRDNTLPLSASIRRSSSWAGSRVRTVMRR